MTCGLTSKSRTLDVSKEDVEAFVVGALGRSTGGESGTGGSPMSGSKESPLRCSSPKPSSAALTKCFALTNSTSRICGSEEILVLTVECWPSSCLLTCHWKGQNNQG